MSRIYQLRAIIEHLKTQPRWVPDDPKLGSSELYYADGVHEIGQFFPLTSLEELLAEIEDMGTK